MKQQNQYLTISKVNEKDDYGQSTKETSWDNGEPLSQWCRTNQNIVTGKIEMDELGLST